MAAPELDARLLGAVLDDVHHDRRRDDQQRHRRQGDERDVPRKVEGHAEAAHAVAEALEERERLPGKAFFYFYHRLGKLGRELLGVARVVPADVWAGASAGAYEEARAAGPGGPYGSTHLGAALP